MMSAKAVLDTTKASFAMEGMYASENDEKNIMDVLTGKRSLEDVITEIKRKYMAEKEQQMDKYYYEYKDDGDVKYCYPEHKQQ